MRRNSLFPLLLQLLYLAVNSWAQRSPYSLQAAVDELHRREASKYPLNAPPSQQHYFAGALGSAAEQDYWDEDSDYPTNNYNNDKNRNRHRLNKALAKYLERENYDAEHGGLSLGPFGGYEFDDEDNNNNNNNLFNNYAEEKKRSPSASSASSSSAFSSPSSSFFRERDTKYDNVPASVFRERETPNSNGPAEHAELTEQFLREIEDAQEHEREERYKDALRHLWEKYQQQENEIEGNLFEDKKRMRTPPYYMLMQKKRSYPVLPWLPYAERKKRFPVSKRSTKRSPSSENVALGKTNEKVARELSELFGTSNDEKKKRSIDEQSNTLSSTHSPEAGSTVLNDMRLELPSKKDNCTEAATQATATNEGNILQQNHHEHHGHTQKQHKHRKRSDRHHSNESREEESHEHEESEEHEGHEDSEEHEDEHEEDEGEEYDDEERKKKRDVANMKHMLQSELFKADQIPRAEVLNSRRKKSIDWSKYFGIDRKKKSVKLDEAVDADMKKRSAADAENNDAEEKDKEKKKRDLDPEKLENMDKKLQSIEDFIIDETIKYTGAHEGIANPEEIRRLKDHVLSRLATAYSLEKMRRALEKLRQSVDSENHLLRNVIEAETRLDENDSAEKEKRLSVKKEKAPMHDGLHLSLASEKSKELNSNAMMSSTADAHNRNSNSNDQDDDTGNEDEEDMKKKKRKRNGYMRYPALPNDFSDFEEELGTGRYESLNDAYLGNKNYIIGSNQCPMLESMAERCRGVDLLSGDLNQELLPICGVHQICYLCGTSQVACDYQYLAEAESICGNSNDCLAAARSVLLILRGSPGPQIGPRECLKNSCLYSAMREIGL